MLGHDHVTETNGTKWGGGGKKPLSKSVIVLYSWIMTFCIPVLASAKVEPYLPWGKYTSVRCNDDR